MIINQNVNNNGIVIKRFSWNQDLQMSTPLLPDQYLNISDQFIQDNGFDDLYLYGFFSPYIVVRDWGSASPAIVFFRQIDKVLNGEVVGHAQISDIDVFYDDENGNVYNRITTNIAVTWSEEAEETFYGFLPDGLGYINNGQGYTVDLFGIQDA